MSSSLISLAKYKYTVDRIWPEGPSLPSISEAPTFCEAHVDGIFSPDGTDGGRSDGHDPTLAFKSQVTILIQDHLILWTAEKSRARAEDGRETTSVAVGQQAGKSKLDMARSGGGGTGSSLSGERPVIRAKHYGDGGAAVLQPLQ